MKADIADPAKKPARRARGGNGSGIAAAVRAPEVGDGSGDRVALLAALQAVADGDFTVRLPGDWTGLDGKIADRFNEIVSANHQMARELARVGTGGRHARARRGSARASTATPVRGARCRSRSTR